MRILVVEDESFVAVDLETRLARMGFEVLGPVDNAGDAIALARAERPDLTLLDIRLRGKGDGIDVAAVLRDELTLPFVFLTGNSDDATLQRATDAQPFGFLVKPFDERELRGTLDTARRRFLAEASLRRMERWLSTTLGSISDAVITLDAGLRIAFVNAAAERLLGVSLEKALGHPLARIGALTLPGDPPDAEPLAAVRDGRALELRAGTRLETPSRSVPIEGHAAPILDDARITGVVIVAHDASEHARVIAERKVAHRRSASLALLGERALSASAPSELVESALRALADGIDAPLVCSLAQREGESALFFDGTLGFTATTEDGPLFEAADHVELSVGSPLLQRPRLQAEGARHGLAAPVGPSDLGRRYLCVLRRDDAPFSEGDWLHLHGVTHLLGLGLARERERRIRAKMLERLIASQERERRTLSRALLDATCQSLGAVLIELRLVESTDSLEGARGAANRLRGLVSSILDELSRLVRELHPLVLDDLGLREAASDLVDAYSRAMGIPIDLRITGSGWRPPREREGELYRVLQESLANIRAHAHARRVRVELRLHEEGVALRIEDDGEGFDPTSVLATSGTEARFGLHAMRERLRLLGGDLAIDSGPGRGTRVEARFVERPR